MIVSGPLIALTGGTGFIGRRFAESARSNGYRIRRLNRHPATDDDARAFDLGAGAIDPAIIDGCDIVVHLAAHIPRDHNDPAEATRCWEVNALGTLRLADAAAKTGVRRFIHSTSANAYAAWEAEPSETAAMFPRSRGYYLGSKIMQEIYATQLCDAAGLSLATLRLGSVYGPGQTTGAIATLAAKITAGEAVTLADEGRFAADFVHIDDVTTALMIAVGQACEGPFNVGSGTRTTIADVARKLVALTGTDPAFITVAPRSGDGDDGFPALSIGRLQELGYAPRSPADGLPSMLTDR